MFGLVKLAKSSPFDNLFFDDLYKVRLMWSIHQSLSFIAYNLMNTDEKLFIKGQKVM